MQMSSAVCDISQSILALLAESRLFLRESWWAPRLWQLNEGAALSPQVRADLMFLARKDDVLLRACPKCDATPFTGNPCRSRTLSRVMTVENRDQCRLFRHPLSLQHVPARTTISPQQVRSLMRPSPPPCQPRCSVPEPAPRAAAFLQYETRWLPQSVYGCLPASGR